MRIKLSLGAIGSEITGGGVVSGMEVIFSVAAVDITMFSHF